MQNHQWNCEQSIFLQSSMQLCMAKHCLVQEHLQDAVRNCILWCTQTSIWSSVNWLHLTISFRMSQWALRQQCNCSNFSNKTQKISVDEQSAEKNTITTQKLHNITVCMYDIYHEHSVGNMAADSRWEYIPGVIYSTTICKLVDLILALHRSECRIPN